MRHSRHTFAVEPIRRGTPLPYVQAQLGHASISMTVDVYGRWLPTGNRALIDRLDGDQPAEAERAVGAAGDSEARGYKLATNPDPDENADPQVVESTGSFPPSPAFYIVNNLFASP